MNLIAELQMEKLDSQQDQPFLYIQLGELRLIIAAYNYRKILKYLNDYQVHRFNN